MHFDWYRATIDQSPKFIIDALQSCYELSDVQPGKPHYGYQYAYDITRGESRLATVMYGGNTGTRALAEASGQHAELFTKNVRELFTGHHLRRADVAIDYIDSAGFESLFGLSTETADLYNLKTSHKGDYYKNKNGRTFEIGSRESPAFNRIYEKGKQTGGNPDHVRTEFEFKPKTIEAREKYAQASPLEILHAVKWSGYYYGLLTGSKALRLAPVGTVRHKTRSESSFEHMIKQYGNMLDAMLIDRFGGDYTEFGLHIAQSVAQRKTAD